MPHIVTKNLYSICTDVLIHTYYIHIHAFTLRYMFTMVFHG